LRDGVYRLTRSNTTVTIFAATVAQNYLYCPPLARRSALETFMAFTKLHLHFDDVQVGDEWTSAGRTITEADIVNFACLSGDFNPIHVDHEFAKTTAFRQRIAHGLLVWSIGSGLSISAPPMRTLAIISVTDWQFKEPVFIDDTIRMISKVLAKEERARGRRGTITWQRKIVKQDGKIAQEGETLTLVEGRRGRGENKNSEK
jgi:3-hydroxybutyryl-CoA dehydratase